MIDVGKKHAQNVGVAASTGERRPSGVRTPNPPEDLVPEAVTSMRQVVEIAARHPALETSPLVALGRYLAACDLLADHEFVNWPNVGRAMGLAAALVQVSIEVSRARRAGEIARDEAEAAIRQRTSQVIANCEFWGEFEGHPVVGILGEGVPWQAMAIFPDDRLAYRIELDGDGATPGWLASCDHMSEAELEWFLSSCGGQGEAGDVPASLSEVVELAHRFRNAVFVTFGIEPDAIPTVAGCRGEAVGCPTDGP